MALQFAEKTERGKRQSWAAKAAADAKGLAAQPKLCRRMLLC
jgi:hypothetical protein